MVKFKYIIHKETNTIIKYDDWLELHSHDNGMYLGKHSYHNEEMIFSDDFEIIYSSEFSNLELISLYGNCATRETRLKLKKRIDQNQNLKREHEIEL